MSNITQFNSFKLRKEINKLIIHMWLKDCIKVETYVYNVDQCKPVKFPRIKRHRYRSIRYPL